MRIRSKILYPYLFLLILAITNWFIQYRKPISQPIKTKAVVQAAADKIAIVTHVIDGDTIEIDTGQKVRYIGIDTPEIHKPKTPIQCFGKEATAKNKELVEGKHIRMEKDISETDRYGRLLRYVYVINDSSPSASLFVNEYLVKEGYAAAATFPPDVKYADHFRQLQNQAMGQRKGLWKTCINESAARH